MVIGKAIYDDIYLKILALNKILDPHTFFFE